MQPQTLTRQASLAAPSRKRFFIMVLLFITVVINYLDRSNLSIAAPALTSDLGIDPIHVGLIFSAFGWTYAAMQIPGGWLVDRVPPRILYTAALLLWSIATVMLGFAGSFIALFVLRMAVGALEAPAYPINSRVVTTWFPERERATAIGFYTSGQFVGLAFLTPVLAWLQHEFGWHMVFVATGAVGILWAVIWYAVYREPRDFKGANEAEIDLIREGGGLVDIQAEQAKVKASFSWTDLGIVLTKRKLWGIYLGQFCLNSTLWFFLTWFPTYLVKYRGMDFIKSGLLASAAVSRRLRRCPVFRVLLGLPDPSWLHSRFRPQVADHQWSADLHFDHRRQLRRIDAAGDCLPRAGVFRQRPGFDHLVAGVDPGSGALARADRRGVQLHRQPVGHRHAYRDRLPCQW